jgi:hypothetical protein
VRARHSAVGCRGCSVGCRWRLQPAAVGSSSGCQQQAERGPCQPLLPLDLPIHCASLALLVRARLSAPQRVSSPLRYPPCPLAPVPPSVHLGMPATACDVLAVVFIPSCLCTTQNNSENVFLPDNTCKVCSKACICRAEATRRRHQHGGTGRWRLEHTPPGGMSPPSPLPFLSCADPQASPTPRRTGGSAFKLEGTYVAARRLTAGVCHPCGCRSPCTDVNLKQEAGIKQCWLGQSARAGLSGTSIRLLALYIVSYPLSTHHPAQRPAHCDLCL